MMANKPNEPNKMSKAEQRKVIAGSLVAVFIISYFIDPMLFFVVVALAIGISIYAIYHKAKRKEDSSSKNEAIPQPRIQLINRDTNSIIDLPDTFEREVDALDAPDVVKYKLRQLGDKAHANHIDELLTYSETPDVLKKYIEKGVVEQKPVGFDADGCHVSDDDLYDADAYESVNTDLADIPHDAMLLNGKPVTFKGKDKNPFEM